MTLPEAGVVGGGTAVAAVGRSTGSTPTPGTAAGLKPPPPLLPFGPTLHYSGCGCPYNWAPGCRLCDWGDSWLQQAHNSLGPRKGEAARLAPIRKLKVAYCIPHANVTGGLKMLLEQMRLLRERGHTVVALTRSELADTAVPPWSDVQVDADVVCRLGQRFRDVYDVDSCDVVVTGIFHQVPEWLTSTTAPVLYYEQGHEWLFGDPVRFREAGSCRAQDTLFHQAMHLPVALAAVSEAVQSIICKEFGRACMLVHNGVDCARFEPGPPAADILAAPTKVLTSPAYQPPAPGERRPSVLLVGNPGLALKGFDCAIATLGLVNRSRLVEVHWVCQQEPSSQLQALADTCSLRISLHINPPQDRLPQLYRGHDCLLFTSQYEAWGMPVLEAMASGLPVVATETAGVGSFATHNLNCLTAPVGDAAELAQRVLSVLEDAPLAARLAEAARRTAQAFTPARVVGQLERVLYSMTACRQELMALRLQALPDSQQAAASAVKACAGVAATQQAQKRARHREDEGGQQQQQHAGHALGALRRRSHVMDMWQPQQSAQREGVPEEQQQRQQQQQQQQHHHHQAQKQEQEQRPPASGSLEVQQRPAPSDSQAGRDQQASQLSQQPPLEPRPSLSGEQQASQPSQGEPADQQKASLSGGLPAYHVASQADEVTSCEVVRVEVGSCEGAAAQQPGRCVLPAGAILLAVDVGHPLAAAHHHAINRASEFCQAPGARERSLATSSG